MARPCHSLQLARLRLDLKYGAKRALKDREAHGPMCNMLKAARAEIENVGEGRKYWLGAGPRAVAVAVHLLKNEEIIAVPTDTVYGLAAMAQRKFTIDYLCGIKKRDKNKPLAICISNLNDIKRWVTVDHIPFEILEMLLPGPVTVVLPRKPRSLEHINPTMTTLGIRIPKCKFIRSVIQVLNEPLALTSANESGQPSCLKPEEFSSLWPFLGAIFNELSLPSSANPSREGSTVVDLTQAGKYKILRDGLALQKTIRTLKFYKLVEQGA